MEPAKYIVYIIKSEQGSYYIGQTKNIEDRLNRHNTNRSRSTKNKGKWELVIIKEFNTRSEAVKFERKLKKFNNTQRAINHIKNMNS